MRRRFLWMMMGVVIGGSLETLIGYGASRFSLSDTTQTSTDSGSRWLSGSHSIDRLRIADDSNVGMGAAMSESRLDVQAGPTDTIIARFGREDDDAFQSLIELRTAKTLIGSGSEIGRGTIRLIDTIASPTRTMELGYYEYGGGLFTNNLFEFWSRGVSVAGIGGASFLAVRDAGDRSDIRLRHNGSQGIIETTGWDPGGIQMGGNGPNIFLTAFGEVMLMTDEGNIGIGTDPDFGTASGVIGVSEARVIPTKNPVQGGILFVEGGALKYRGPQGTVTTIAEP